MNKVKRDYEQMTREQFRESLQAARAVIGDLYAENRRLLARSQELCSALGWALEAVSKSDEKFDEVTDSALLDKARAILANATK